MTIGNIFESATSSAGVMPSSNGHKKPGHISSILKKLSRYGMTYDEDVYRNMRAIPADKLLQKDDPSDIMQSMYSNLSWKFKPEEEKTFAEKSLDQKRQILRKMATQPEIDDILEIMANECIVYDDDDAYICHPYIDNSVIQDLNEKYLDKIRKASDVIFYRIYLLADFKNKAWDVFRRWLVDGDIAYQIVYDDITNPKNIIGLIDIDPATLTRVVKNGTTYWVQFKDVIGKERTLLDSEIIYIKYEDSGVIERQSYLERLIRPFNVYRIVEQAQVIWTVTQSSFKTIFTVPVRGLTRAKGMQSLQAAMNKYKEDITFDDSTGELKVNGKMMLPFNREYFFPENDSGKIEIDTLTDQGPALMDSEQLRWFESKLYKMSKIPASRFDKEMQATWFGTDPSQQLRDEINFSRFVSRLQHQWSQIILKPLQIQLALQMPELKNDKRILNSISIQFNSYNQFVELMEQQIDMTRMEHIQTLKDTFTTTDAEGNEEHFFCDTFLIQRYLKMSDADLELNEKLKAIEQAKKKKQGDDEGGDEGGDEDNPSDSLDAELGLDDKGSGDDGGSGDDSGAEDEGGKNLEDELAGEDIKPEEPSK